MDEQLRSLAGRLRGESGGSVAYERLLVTEDREELAG
ncbi:adenylosuccinate lyase, partial [Streptomyces lunaelactis]|nr:adenylosuccinate lyase [Streptomyces lunaelactis]